MVRGIPPSGTVNSLYNSNVRSLENIPDVRFATEHDEVRSTTFGIQEAINSLPSTGGMVFISPGTHTISTGVVVDKSNVLIQGAGQSTIIATDGMAEDFFSFTAMENVRFRDFAILGTNQTAGNGIAAIGTCFGCSADDVKMSGIFGSNTLGLEAKVRISTDYDSATSFTAGIQEAIDDLPTTGGSVFIPAGTYTLKASIIPIANCKIMGDGPSTVLTIPDEIDTLLTADALAAQADVTVADSTGLEVGMRVNVSDANSLEANSTSGTILAIVGNVITLDTNIVKDCTVAQTAKLIFCFNIIDANDTGDYLEICNLKLDGNLTGRSYAMFYQRWYFCSGIHIDSCEHSKVHHIWVENFRGDGLTCGSVGGGLHDFQYHDISLYNVQGNGIHIGGGNLGVSIKNSYFENCPPNTTAGGGRGAIYFCHSDRYCNVSGNTFIDCWAKGIAGVGAGGTGDRYNLIANNTFYGQGNVCIDCDDIVKMAIIGNVSYEHGNHAGPGYYAAIALDNSGDCIVANNYIESTTSQCGINIWDSEKIVCEGNMLQSMDYGAPGVYGQGAGILMVNAQKCIFEDNICWDNGVNDYGISLVQNGVGVCSKNIISDNICYQTGATLQDKGIVISAGCEDNVIRGNIVDENESATIEDLGTATIIENNVGYIHSGENRSVSGSLIAGVANEICFAWNNPETQDIIIKKVVVNVTTAGGTGGSHLDIGISDDAAGTNRGVEFFDDLLLNSVQINDSGVGGDGGTQTKWVSCEDSVSAVDDWIVGQILDANAASLVGRYYIEYVGA